MWPKVKYIWKTCCLVKRAHISFQFRCFWKEAVIRIFLPWTICETWNTVLRVWLPSFNGWILPITVNSRGILGAERWWGSVFEGSHSRVVHVGRWHCSSGDLPRFPEHIKPKTVRFATKQFPLGKENKQLFGELQKLLHKTHVWSTDQTQCLLMLIYDRGRWQIWLVFLQQKISANHGNHEVPGYDVNKTHSWKAQSLEEVLCWPDLVFDWQCRRLLEFALWHQRLSFLLGCPASVRTNWSKTGTWLKQKTPRPEYISALSYALQCLISGQVTWAHLTHITCALTTPVIARTFEFVQITARSVDLFWDLVHLAPKTQQINHWTTHLCGSSWPPECAPKFWK